MAASTQSGLTTPHISEHLGEPSFISELQKERINLTLGYLVREHAFPDDPLYRGYIREAYNATHDPLTGLLNRNGLERKYNQLEQLAEHDPSFRGAFLFIDLDDFKETNDNHGHNAGDALLAKTAHELSDSFVLRGGDFLARLAGDEFIAFIKTSHHGNGLRHPKSEDEAIEGAISRIKKVALDVGVKLSLGTTSVSVGASKWSPGKTLVDILKEADTNMYLDKARKESDKAKKVTV